MSAREVRKPRMVRVEQSVWDAAREKADTNSETVSDVVRRALVNYVMRNK